MKRNDFSDILSGIEKDEFILFGEYIKSPYFKIHKRLINLFEYINKHFESVKSGKPGRDEICRKILGNDASGENSRKLTSDFQKTLDKFFSQLEFDSDTDYKNIAMLKQLRLRKLKDRFSQRVKEFTKGKKDSKEFDESFYRFMADLNNETRLFEPLSEFHNYSPSLQDNSDYLDHYFISEKLFLFQLMFSKQYLNKKSPVYNRGLWKPIEEYVLGNIDHIKANSPEIYLRYIMLKMLEFKDDALINEYSSYLDSSASMLSYEKLSVYYRDLSNYLTIRIGRGETYFRKPLFELFRTLDKKELLSGTKDNALNYFDFKQIVDTAIYLKELEWLEYFIDKFKSKLEDDNRANIVNLAYAKLFCFKNEFPKARVHLSKVGKQDFILYLDAKQLLAGIDYDEGKFAEVLQTFDSVKKYIKSGTNIPSYQIESTDLYIHYLKKLIKINETTDTGEAEFGLKKLSDMLSAEKRSVYARKWLEDKIDLLKK